MIDYQEDILNDGQICMNCMGLLRREAVRPVRYRNADLDEDLNRVMHGDSYVARYNERLSWRTSVDDVPDESVSESGTMFCACGADGAFTRIWDDVEVGVSRLRELLVTLAETLRSRDYIVDMRSMAEAANEAFHHDPRPGLCDRPNSIDEVLEAAVDAGVEERTTESPQTAVA